MHSMLISLSSMLPNVAEPAIGHHLLSFLLTWSISLLPVVVQRVMTSFKPISQSPYGTSSWGSPLLHLMGPHPWNKKTKIKWQKLDWSANPCSMHHHHSDLTQFCQQNPIYKKVSLDCWHPSLWARDHIPAHPSPCWVCSNCKTHNVMTCFCSIAPKRTKKMTRLFAKNLTKDLWNPPSLPKIQQQPQRS